MSRKNREGVGQNKTFGKHRTRFEAPTSLTDAEGSSLIPLGQKSLS